MFVVCERVNFIVFLLVNDYEHVGVEFLIEAFGFPENTAFGHIERIILVTLLALACGRPDCVIT